MKTKRPSASRPGTHIAQRQTIHLTNMQQVMFLLGWSELRYCYHKYRQGFTYLNVVTGYNGWAIHCFERSPLYWGWWKNHWAHREEEFLLEVESERIGPSEYRARYEDLHDAQTLAQGESQYGKIMEVSYDQLVPALVKESQADAFRALESAGI